MFYVVRYRAYGCRENAHWLADGSLVYHVAGVGVVLSVEDNRQRHYLHHTDDILCLVVHPDGKTVASGQVSLLLHIFSPLFAMLWSFNNNCSKYCFLIFFYTLLNLASLMFFDCWQLGKNPVVHIWSSRTLRILSFLEGGHTRGVCCLGFSRDGDRLASIGLDDHNSLVIWDWEKGVKIATARYSYIVWIVNLNMVEEAMNWL